MAVPFKMFQAGGDEGEGEEEEEEEDCPTAVQLGSKSRYFFTRPPSRDTPIDCARAEG